MSDLFVYGKGLEQTFDQCAALVTPSEWEEEKVVGIHAIVLIRINYFFCPSQLKYDAEEGQTAFPVGILIETKSSEGSFAPITVYIPKFLHEHILSNFCCIGLVENFWCSSQCLAVRVSEEACKKRKEKKKGITPGGTRTHNL